MFKVPIIPPDLRHEETIIQAAYALDCLQNTIVTIFGRIDERIEKNNVKVKELQGRIQKSQAKINSLQGTRKAIRIYAPARFPASNIFKDLPVTFDEENKSALKPAAIYQVQKKLDTNLPSFNEKLIFFHVRDQNSVKMMPESSLAKERCNIKQNKDLGIMPSDLRSIPSVLLFNTDYSVYNLDECESEKLSHADTWKRSKLFKNKRQQHENYQPGSVKQILEPAPHSLIHRRNEKLTPSGGLKYTPKLSEAPELDLPLDLPDLPGIADDLRYESPEAKQKIAPSLALVVENLPELTELMKNNVQDAQVLIEGPDNDSTIAPPPPPPPPPAVMKSAAPPPPPPPPTSEHKISQIQANITERPTISNNSIDTRSELMAAIRNAGGKARLRSTAAAPLATNDNDVVDNTRSNNPSTKKTNLLGSSQGGDLMADLHNKLLMRRKGISGSKENKGDIKNIKNIDNTVQSITPSGNPVISRLSSLIPAPPVTKRSTRNTATTSEEDDEDDSNENDWVD